MKHNWFSIFLFLTLLVSCLEEKQAERNYPKIVTNQVTEISSTGALFAGVIESSALDEISEYGFVWSLDNKLLPEDSFSIKLTKLRSNSISIRVSATLIAHNNYYTRFYIKTVDKTLYGNLVTFKIIP